MNSSQIRIMLGLQGAMNARVNPEWLTAEYPWLRAVVVEGVEAMGHHGWKWWKKEELDLPQVQLELVDIWHFALSHILCAYTGQVEQAAGYIERGFDTAGQFVSTGIGEEVVDIANTTLMGKLEIMVGMAVARRFSLPLFRALMSDVGMSSDELFRQYVSKNVLNFFRQDHGYKSGTYQKIWHGKEDNVVLCELMETIPASDTFEVDLYAALVKHYDTVPH